MGLTRYFFSLTKSAGRRFAALAAAVLLLLCGGFTAYADYSGETPSLELTAESAICYDAETNAVIYEKNAYARQYPASITKVMTALVVLEHCKLDEEVTFSYDAVYNVDSGSSNAEIDAGDVLSVEDCLYALLLKSANEAANALAEHVAGSREAFAQMMNEEALALGCRDTHFTNPSGLHDEDHYTTAYDMALIGAAAMQNKDFMKIDSQTSHQLAPTQRVPEGKKLYMEHKMLQGGTDYTDERAVAGKTGYTQASGNTLITMAQQDGRSLVAVVLKDKNPQHYQDTAALLDLGFDRYENKALQDKSLFDKQAIWERLVTDTIIAQDSKPEELEAEKKILLTLPVGADETGISSKLDYNLPQAAPERAVARIAYTADGRQAGSYYILKSPTIKVILDEAPTEAKVAVVSLSTLALIAGVAAFFLLGGGTAALHLRNVRRENARMKELRERRRKRLAAMDISEEEFQEMVEKRKAEKSDAAGRSRKK